MEIRPPWATPDIDLSVPSLARVYDAHLGGSHNFAVDRAMAAEVERAVPGWVRAGSWSNRAFLGRAVRYCAGQGIDQFLDVGSGIPTMGNVHEVAQSVNPDARTVYVDIDGVAVMMAREILAGDPNSAAVHGDLRTPATILADPDTRRLIDFDRPVAVLLVAILHAVPDTDRPAELVRRLTAPAVPGSLLVVSHIDRSSRSPERIADVERVLARSTTPSVFRTAEQLRAMLADFEPVEPGIVPLDRWHPDTTSRPEKERSTLMGVVARKNGPG